MARRAGADIDARWILLRVVEMVCELPQLREMDINPIIVDEPARWRSMRASSSPRPAAAVRVSYTTWRSCHPARQEQVADKRRPNTPIRPIRPDDADMLQAFVREACRPRAATSASPAACRAAARMLARFTLIDYDREMALVAIVEEHQRRRRRPRDHTERIVGVSRYITNPTPRRAVLARGGRRHGRARGWARGCMLPSSSTGAHQGLTQIIQPDPERQRQDARADAQPGLQVGAFPGTSRSPSGTC